MSIKVMKRFCTNAPAFFVSSLHIPDQGAAFKTYHTWTVVSLSGEMSPSILMELLYYEAKVFEEALSRQEVRIHCGRETEVPLSLPAFSINQVHC